MTSLPAATWMAASKMLGLQFTNTVGEPDAADALAHIEDGEALVRIFDTVIAAWAAEAASSLPGNYSESLAALRDVFSTALHESDFFCELRKVREHLEECRSYGDPNRSLRTHAGRV